MKTRNLFSKVLAGLLAVLMLVGLLPVFALADEADTGVEGLYLDKAATLTDDGTYTITLEAYATGSTLTVLKQTPTDVVLVLDVSGSMDQNFNMIVGKEWTSVKDLVRNHPADAYHLCADGTYSTVTWSTEGTLNSTHRYTCDNCKATRKWSTPLWNTIPGEGEDDSWNLWRYTDVTKSQHKMTELKSAVKAFLAGVAAKNAGIADVEQQHRVSIVKFASEDTKNTIGNDTYQSGGSSYNYTQTVAGLTNVNSDTVGGLNAAVDALVPGGATAVDKGVEMAQGILANSGDRDTVVIVFTDGDPTHSSSFSSSVAVDAITTAGKLKAGGTTVYTVGLFTGADTGDTTSEPSNKFMNAMSSNYPGASAVANGSSDITVTWGTGGNNGYYKAAGETANLTDIFEQISTSVGTTTVTLDENAVLKDVLNDGFVMTSSSTVTVQTAKYSGRDRNGIRVFADPVDSGLTANVSGGTITVSGFDYSTEYLLDGDSVDDSDFRAAKQGKKLIVTITGVEATDAAITDALVNTNSAVSGIYATASDENPAALFPIPKTQLSTRTYVLDYAKEAVLTDMPSSVIHMDADGMNKFSAAVTGLSMAYGNADSDSYTPTTMQWDGYDKYYVFGAWGTTPDGVTTGSNTWTKVNVLPANNVYYEDTFISNESTGTVGITYTGDWAEEVTPGANAEDANGAVQGWIEDLSDDTGDSDGTIHMSSTKGATATFEFTGTGFDVYSRTNLTSGKVYAKISWTDEDGTHNKGLIVDTESASGEYYSIPTLWFSGDYNTYTVKITVQNDAEDGADYSFCIDGIRIYNPMYSEETVTDPVVGDAYGEELNAYFQTVRDMLITQEDFNGTVEDTVVDGFVFIDKNGDGTVSDTSNVLAEYVDYGPKNEVYLAPGQGIAFNVGTVTNVQVGLKAPEGSATALVSYQNGTAQGQIKIPHSTDLYYEVTPDENGYVVIKNGGEDLLSITKVKLIVDDADQEVGIMTTSLDDMLVAVDTFDTMPVVAYSLAAFDPDTSDDAETSTEPEEPTEPEESTEPTNPGVEIENPENPANPEKPSANKQIEELVKKLFDAFRGWFKP